MAQRPEPYREFVREPIFSALDRLAAIAADRGISMGGLALAWLLADERVGQIVVGPGRPEHLAVVGEALRNPLTNQEAAMVEGAMG
jgi:aryl-alcohol dehydrogenase-like predicted oxidoreductase